jgi:hypothetical protein
MKEEKDVVTINRPTGPRVVAGPPRTQGYLERYVPRRSISRAKQAASAVASVITRPRVSAAAATIALAIFAHVATSTMAHFVAMPFWSFTASRTAAHDPSGYQGPGDVAGSAAKFWWGLRAYSAATRGNNAIQLCDAAGANCTNVATDAATGALNAPTNIGGTDCTAVTTCRINTFYDQAGTSCTTACDLVQATDANRATFTWNSGAPYAVFDGATTKYASASLASSVSQTYLISIVGYVSPAPGGLQQVISANNGAGNTVGFTNNATQSLWMYASSALPTQATTLNAWLSLQYSFNGASSAFEQNGTSNTVSSSPGATAFATGAVALGSSIFNSTRWFGGRFREGGLWAGTPVDMTTNQRTFWGF